MSRLVMDVLDSGLDLSREPKFTEAVANKVYYGPIYFRRESEPYMTLSLAGTRKDAGVSIAEVNLKLIWDVVSQIKVGERGNAYVVGKQGRLIAHPDISLVLRNTDMSKLTQVQAAQAGGTDAGPDSLQGALNIQGQEVLTASAPIAPLRWRMFVELPVTEAYASLYAALQRLALVLLAALVFAVLAGMFLAGRMVGPIKALRAGAERFGAGDFNQRISIRPATNSRASPTSSTTWARGCRNPISTLRRRSKRERPSSKNRCSSKPRPPRCSRSSAVRRSICKPCSTPSWNRRPACATPMRELFFVPWMMAIVWRQAVDSKTRRKITSRHSRPCPNGEASSDVPCWKARRFMSLTSWPTLNMRRPQPAGPANSGPCSACRCCGMVPRSAYSC